MALHPSIRSIHHSNITTTPFHSGPFSPALIDKEIKYPVMETSGSCSRIYIYIYIYTPTRHTQPSKPVIPLSPIQASFPSNIHRHYVPNAFLLLLSLLSNVLCRRQIYKTILRLRPNWASEKRGQRSFRNKRRRSTREQDMGVKICTQRKVSYKNMYKRNSIGAVFV